MSIVFAPLTSSEVTGLSVTAAPASGSALQTDASARGAVLFFTKTVEKFASHMTQTDKWHDLIWGLWFCTCVFCWDTSRNERRQVDLTQVLLFSVSLCFSPLSKDIYPYPYLIDYAGILSVAFLCVCAPACYGGSWLRAVVLGNSPHS